VLVCLLDDLAPKSMGIGLPPRTLLGEKTRLRHGAVARGRASTEGFTGTSTSGGSRCLLRSSLTRRSSTGDQHPNIILASVGSSRPRRLAVTLVSTKSLFDAPPPKPSVLGLGTRSITIGSQRLATQRRQGRRCHAAERAQPGTQRPRTRAKRWRGHRSSPAWEIGLPRSLHRSMIVTCPGEQ
jgi:hypothetical protein